MGEETGENEENEKTREKMLEEGGRTERESHADPPAEGGDPVGWQSIAEAPEEEQQEYKRWKGHTQKT